MSSSPAEERAPKLQGVNSFDCRRFTQSKPAILDPIYRQRPPSSFPSHSSPNLAARPKKSLAGARSFRRRVPRFPVNVDVLSSFRSFPLSSFVPAHPLMPPFLFCVQEIVELELDQPRRCCLLSVRAATPPREGLLAFDLPNPVPASRRTPCSPPPSPGTTSTGTRAPPSHSNATTHHFVGDR